ncbi:LacI family DNA-binding transcriptional regulator [Larkinella humicola]|uniref:LacI family transcriptional regulator n=1 Tax=Larkinella humicola TaxID=2607654 RepID=A0A5N1JAX4_9BACT|nr:substrate-binding domain-containing protein [Larkinella humicola]KAA9349832.1 LacI family transcriptional regulator [Larkinella humicola]
MTKIIRIKDIAEMANVSMGTVDRVIHNRGKVSEDALKKVLEVLEQINYKPNLIARTLSSSKTQRLAVLLPDADLDPFWRSSILGIRQAYSEHNQFGVAVSEYLFDPYSGDSFREQARKALEWQPDGILLAPTLRQEALAFAEACQTNQIPLVCFNTHINELAMLSFIGQDLHQSGRVAAELMAMMASPGTILVTHIGEQVQNSVHIGAKETGFREFMAQKGRNHFEVITVQLASPTSPDFENSLAQTLETHPHTKGIYVTTSKAYEIARTLEKLGKTHVCLIGYDLIDDNLTYLRSGTINSLIHQNSDRQGFLGISYLTDYLVFQKPIPALRYLPLSIVTRENLDSYLSNIDFSQ